MNNLYKAKVYLAGNIQNSSDSIHWREELTERLKELHIVALNPRVNCFLNQISEDDEMVRRLKENVEYEHYDYVHDCVQQIIRRDLRMVDVADFLIVNLEPTLPTYGTIHEVIMASTQRKPIIFRIDDKKNFPMWLFGLVDHNLIFDSFDTVIGYLKSVNYKDIDELDNKYWKIFSEDYR